MASTTPDAHAGVLDINAVFRSGGRAVEFLDRINQACLVMLYETGIVPREHAQRIAVGINTVRDAARAEAHTTGFSATPQIISITSRASWPWWVPMRHGSTAAAAGRTLPPPSRG